MQEMPLTSDGSPHVEVYMGSCLVIHIVQETLGTLLPFWIDQVQHPSLS